MKVTSSRASEVLNGPKRSFGFSHKLVPKNPKELFGQANSSESSFPLLFLNHRLTLDLTSISPLPNRSLHHKSCFPRAIPSELPAQYVSKKQPGPNHLPAFIVPHSFNGKPKLSAEATRVLHWASLVAQL